MAGGAIRGQQGKKRKSTDVLLGGHTIAAVEDREMLLGLYRFEFAQRGRGGEKEGKGPEKRYPPLHGKQVTRKRGRMRWALLTEPNRRTGSRKEGFEENQTDHHRPR